MSWQETWNTIVTVLDPIISLISTVLEAGWLLIQAGAQIAWAAISQYIIQPIQEAYDWVSTKIGELVTWLSTQWELIKALLGAYLNNILLNLFKKHGIGLKNDRCASFLVKLTVGDSEIIYFRVESSKTICHSACSGIVECNERKIE